MNDGSEVMRRLRAADPASAVDIDLSRVRAMVIAETGIGDSDSVTELPGPVEVPQSPAEVPQSPAEVPQSPAEVPQSAAEVPQDPAEVPQDPAEVPQDPAEVPQDPAEVPQDPAEVPQDPAEVPQDPAEVPQDPAEVPQDPAEVPQSLVLAGKSGMDTRFGRSRRLGRILQVAAGTLIGIGLAGGGYWAGISSEGSQSGSLRPMAGPDVAVAGESAAQSGMSEDAPAPGVGAQLSPTRHRGIGLSDESGTGTVYEIVPAQLSAADFEHLAQSWQVTGPIRANENGWTATTDSATLTMAQSGAVVYIDLTIPENDPTRCGLPGSAEAVCNAAGSSDIQGWATDLLTSAGIELGTLGPGSVSGDAAEFHQMIDGQPVPFGWKISASGAGVYRVIGQSIGGVQTFGTYDLLSPADAVSRLDDTGFLGWSVTMVDTSSPPLPRSAPSAVPGVQGTGLPWPVTEITVTDSVYGLAWDESAGMLVPAYAFHDEYSTWVVPALTGEAMVEVSR